MAHEAMDKRFMAAALAFGARGLGQVWPNPSVACVLVKDGRIIARGRTGTGGRPHAETEALRTAGPEARGSTAYVTLEPCAHHGSTPPCADSLVAAQVARVVVPLTDPNPVVAGRGLQILRDAGIEVSVGVLGEKAWSLNQGFFLRLSENRPLVTLKLASSFDGRIATATGESKWITGPAARARVHAERLNHDLILVGGGTARADDPELSVRGMGLVSQPVRAVASRRLNIPLDGRLIETVDQGPVWALIDSAMGAVSGQALNTWTQRGGRVVRTPTNESGNLDPLLLLRNLGREGITRVFCEGGGALAASLLSAGLVDRILGFTSGVVLGAEAQPSLGVMGIDSLGNAPRFSLALVERIGPDVLHTWERKTSYR